MMHDAITTQEDEMRRQVTAATKLTLEPFKVGEAAGTLSFVAQGQ